MIIFTYDQAYKINFDIKESKSKRDFVALAGINLENIPELFANYIDMCCNLPTSAPSLSIHDDAIIQLTKFYKTRS